jgi:hypothetical protein
MVETGRFQKLWVNWIQLVHSHTMGSVNGFLPSFSIQTQRHNLTHLKAKL